MNPRVDKFINRAPRWRQEMAQLRRICLDGGLTEELKWDKPCYTFQESNIVIIQPFKKFCALMFFKGSLLEDREGILEKPGRNSRVARRVPFTGAREIVKMEPILNSYIRAAIEAEKAGLKLEVKGHAQPVPEELQSKLDENPTLKKAFEALTPGRQRGYILYFSGAKQSKTRARRVEKYVDNILNGKGLNDR